jgi:hypothetical protein
MKTPFGTCWASFSHEKRQIKINDLQNLLGWHSYNCHRHGTCLDSRVTLCKTLKTGAPGDGANLRQGTVCV